MRFPPLSVIETWPIPNYVDPPTQKPYLIPVLVLLTFAATCMVILRIYARLFHFSAGSDDWLVVLAIVPGIAYTVCISIAVTHFGWARHIWDIPPGPGNINEVKERAISWASQMLYVWTANLTKLSMLCFYRRAFTTPVMQKVVMWFLAITLVYHLLCIILLCVECRPLNFYWEEFRYPAPTHGVCGDEGTGLTTTGILNVILDFIILILPIRTVLALDILWTQKLQVLSMFAAGILIVICSTLRVYYVWQTTEVTYDVTWKGYIAYLFTGVEMFVGLICACLPACRGLLKQWRQSAKHSEDNSTGVAKHEFSTTMDSTRVSMPPPNAIKKKTRTTVDISYRKMENLPNDNSSQLSLGGVSSLNASDSRTMVWGANGSAINITKAWAGKERKPNRSSMIDDEEEVEMEKLRLCATSIRGEGKMDIGSVRKVAFENLSGGRSSRAEQRREEEV